MLTFGLKASGGILLSQRARMIWLAAAIVYSPASLMAEQTGSEAALYSSGNFGGIGLLQMRNARFAPDGDLSIGLTYQDDFQRYFVTWQATPWLETTLSYADAGQPETGTGTGTDQFGVDRSFDIKLRLLKEGKYQPAVALGIQDGLGNGRFSGEYIVASKRYYDFDLTLGLGWGYLAQRNQMYNIFRAFSDSFDHRSMDADNSGKIRTDNYFSGQKMALFAGVEYQSPIKGLSLKAEYNSARISTLEGLSHLKDKSAFNFGLNYKATSWMDVALGYERGERIALRLVLKQNLHEFSSKKLGFAKSLLEKVQKEKSPAEINVRRKAQNSDNEVIKNTQEVSENKKIFAHLKALGFYVRETTYSSGRIQFHLEIMQGKKPDKLFGLGAILQFYDEAEVILEEKGHVIARLKAAKDDNVGKLALGRFSRSPSHLRELASLDRVKHQNQIAEHTLDVLRNEKLRPLSVSLKSRVATIHKRVGPYKNIPKNIGRTARILTGEMPDYIDAFRIISKKNDMFLSDVTLLRKDFENASQYTGSPEEIWAGAEILDPQKIQIKKTDQTKSSPDKGANSGYFQQDPYPLFEWGIRPAMLTHFGGTDDGKFRKDISAAIFGKIKLDEHLTLGGVFKQYIAGNIDQIPLQDNPAVPAVRSDVALYSAEGRSALEKLQLDYIHTVAPGLYSRLSAGLMESMFAGVGGEILYRPYGSILAVGLDLNWVKQRGYDQLFSFRDYNVLSGHVSVYHENIKYNITSKLSVGRYLAGDFGGTFDISRRFDNGIRIGLWATYTDMSSETFGEGSFDKGIYMKIPLELFWPGSSRDNMRVNFKRLGKNGGQQLLGTSRLYEMLSSGQERRLKNNWHNILE